MAEEGDPDSWTNLPIRRGLLKQLEEFVQEYKRKTGAQDPRFRNPSAAGATIIREFLDRQRGQGRIDPEVQKFIEEEVERRVQALKDRTKAKALR